MVVINSNLVYSVNHKNNNLIIITQTKSKIAYLNVPKEIYDEFIDSDDPDTYYTTCLSEYDTVERKITFQDEVPKQKRTTF
jgi:hypothetical protein